MEISNIDVMKLKVQLEKYINMEQAIFILCT
jgi:hypothetical protein